MLVVIWRDQSTGYATLSTALHTQELSLTRCENLLPVCLNLRHRYPDVPIIVYADNDHGPDNDRADNPGVRRGKEAAEAVGGRCVWPTARPGQKSTDYVDLWLECPWYFGREVRA